VWSESVFDSQGAMANRRQEGKNQGGPQSLGLQQRVWEGITVQGVQFSEKRGKEDAILLFRGEPIEKKKTLTATRGVAKKKKKNKQKKKRKPIRMKFKLNSDLGERGGNQKSLGVPRR